MLSSFSAPASPDAATQALATELFQRVRASAAMGVFGVFVLLYMHWAVTAQPVVKGWVVFALASFIVRFALAGRAPRMLAAGVPPLRLVNAEAGLSVVSGLAWALALLVFDTGRADAPFFMRLLILAAALAFTTGSLAVFLRVYFGFALALFVPTFVFITAHEYVARIDGLMLCALLFLGAVISVARTNNMRSRKAVADHREVIALSEQLQQALHGEQEARAAMSLLARTDELTGMANRRAVLDQLTIEFARCERFVTPLTVLMIDVDHFKSVNDTYGHACGDEALRAVARVMQGVLRETDIAGRFGGEEFVAVLPALAGEVALATAERLRQAVADLCIETERGEIVLTVSIGVAFFQSGRSVDQVLSRADHAMYSAKRRGRNRCEIEIAD